MMTPVKKLTPEQAERMGFSRDRRRRRRQHRAAARNLLRGCGFFNTWCAPGSTFASVAAWHLAQARLLTMA